MQFMQFVLDSDGKDKIDETEEMVINHLRASLAADDNPENDNTPIRVSHIRGTDSLYRAGTYVLGETSEEPPAYPAVQRSDWEIPGAEADKAAGDPSLVTDMDEDDFDYIDHMIGKVVG